MTRTAFDLPALERHDDTDAYYAAGAGRRRAREWDYGVWWSLPAPHDHPAYRLTIVDAVPRPEVVLVEPAGTVHVIARMPATDDPDRDAEAVLTGWAEECGRGKLPWVYAMLDGAPDGWDVAAWYEPTDRSLT